MAKRILFVKATSMGGAIHAMLSLSNIATIMPNVAFDKKT